MVSRVCVELIYCLASVSERLLRALRQVFPNLRSISLDAMHLCFTVDGVAKAWNFLFFPEERADRSEVGEVENS